MSLNRGAMSRKEASIIRVLAGPLLPAPTSSNTSSSHSSSTTAVVKTHPDLFTSKYARKRFEMTHNALHRVLFVPAKPGKCTVFKRPQVGPDQLDAAAGLNSISARKMWAKQRLAIFFLISMAMTLVAVFLTRCSRCGVRAQCTRTATARISVRVLVGRLSRYTRIGLMNPDAFEQNSFHALSFPFISRFSIFSFVCRRFRRTARWSCGCLWFSSLIPHRGTNVGQT